MERYYVDRNGVFLGIFVGAKPPPSSVEIKSLPPTKFHRWNGNRWIEHSNKELIIKKINEIDSSITVRRILDALYDPDGNSGVNGLTNLQWLDLRRQEQVALRSEMNSLQSS